MMSSPDDVKKRVILLTPSPYKKVKTPTLQSNVIELQSLLQAMEEHHPNATMSEQALAFRVQRCLSLWNQLVNDGALKKVDLEKYNALQQQVQRACPGGGSHVVIPVHPTIQRIFFESESSNATGTKPIHPNKNNPKDDDDDDTEPSAEIVVPKTRPQQQPVNVQDMQKQQQEQIQEAVSQMASKLKEETVRIHSTLQQQTDQLDEMEDLVTENVSNVTDLTKDVQQHVAKGWSQTIGTWTMLFTVVGAFLFAMVTISMVPKREGACLFACPKAEDPFCRVLPSGRKECIPVKDSREEQQKVDPGKEHAQGECTVGMDGECVVSGSRKNENEKSNKPRNSNSNEKRERDTRSARNVFAEEAVIDDEIDPNIPFYNGRPFAGKEVRKAAAGGDLRALSAMVEIKPDFIDAPDSNGWSALHLSARAGHEEIVRFLLEHGSNAALETSNGRSALDIAYGKHGADHPISKLLEQVADAHVPPANEGKQQVTAISGDDLRDAAQRGDLPQLMTMLLSAPDLIDSQDSNNWTPLHLSVRAGHIQVAQYLVDAGCNTQLKTVGGESALSVAVRSLGSDHDIVHLLSGQPGAEPMVGGRIFTEHEVQLAAQQGNLQLLKEMGAVKREWLEAQDENGWASIHQAARGGHADIVAYLLEQKCDRNLVTRNGSTALDIAIDLHGENNPVVGLLMDANQSS